MIRLLFVISLALSLWACDFAKTVTGPVDMKTAAQAAFTAKSTYAIALAAATTYAKLPRCGQPTSPPLCSDVAVLAQMRKADLAADAATQSAEDAVRNLGTQPQLVQAAITGAEATVQAFKAITDVYAPKGGS